MDLGYAPGSWSQVAKNRVGESGRVVGIDVIPALPPRGVSALQGDFLSEGVQGLVREFVREWKGGEGGGGHGDGDGVVERVRGAGAGAGGGGEEGMVDVDVVEEEGGREQQQQQEVDTVAAMDGEVTMAKNKPSSTANNNSKMKKNNSHATLDLQQGRVVDVVLSDMCAPFPGLELSSWSNSVNRPYRRMMNTSGNPFRDHAGSIVSFLSLFLFTSRNSIPLPFTHSSIRPAYDDLSIKNKTKQKATTC